MPVASYPQLWESNQSSDIARYSPGKERKCLAPTPGELLICRVHCPRPLRLVPLPSGIYKGTSQSSWKMEEKDKLIFVQKVFEIHAWFFHNTHFPWTLWRPPVYSSQCPFVLSLKPNTVKPSSFSQLPSGYQPKAAETASYLQAIFSLPITGEPSQVSAGPV